MAGVVTSGLFNALAFAGAGYLFKMIDKGGYEEEIKRHDMAIESLNAAKEKWYERQVEKKNEIARLRQELSDANADINATNKALLALKKVQMVSHEGRTFDREPRLRDYYKPSSEMEEYQHMVVGLTGLTGGYAVAKMLL